MANDGAPSGGLRHANRGARLRERADLIQFHEHGVGRPFRDPAFDALRIRREKVVADQLRAVAKTLGKQRPALPIVLHEAVLDADDRILPNPLLVVAHEFRAGERDALPGERVPLAVVELAGRDVQRQNAILAGAVARFFDCLDEQLDRRLVRGKGRRDSPLVADVRGHAARAHDGAQRLVDLRAAAQPLGETAEADRHHHKLLKVRGVRRVPPAVEQIEHRGGQQRAAPQTAVERESRRARRRMRRRERNRENGVRPKRGLVGRAVQVQHRLIHGILIGRVEAANARSDPLVDVGDRGQDALAAVARPPVAQLQSLMRARARAGRDGGPSARAVVKRNRRFHGGVSARVEDLARPDIRDSRHSLFPPTSNAADQRGAVCNSRSFRSRAAARAFSTASAGESARTTSSAIPEPLVRSHVSRPMTGVPSASACAISESVP